MTAQEAIFDTRIDTNKIYVSMNTSFKPRNYIDNEGKSSLYLHITGEGKRERLNLDIKIAIKNWLKKKQQLKCVDAHHTDINLIIDNIKAKITNIKTVYRLSEMQLTPARLKYELVNDMPRVNFCTFFGHMLEQEKLHLKPGTYRRHLSVLNKIKNFMPELFFNEITVNWFEKFKKHCRANKNKETTINSNVRSIKKFLFLAERAGIKLSLNLKDVKGGSMIGNRESLNPTELKRLFRFYNSEFINPSLKITVGYFLFSCMTGLRFSDVMALERPLGDANTIDFRTIKTSKNQIIALNVKAKEIINSCPDLFKVKYTNEHINRELKTVMKNISVNKKLTFHVARHTFATTYLRVGGKIEKLQQLLGHSNINETMIYTHIVAAEANEDIFLIDTLWE